MTEKEIRKAKSQAVAAFDFVLEHMDEAEPYSVRPRTDITEGAYVVHYAPKDFAKLVNGNPACVVHDDEWIHLTVRLTDRLFLVTCQIEEYLPEDLKEKYGLN